MPGYIKNLPQLRAKGVDIVAVVAFNDPFVMSAWGKANEVRGDEIVSIPATSEYLVQSLTRFGCSCSSPIPMPSSPRALAGLMRHPAARAGTPLSLTTAKSAMRRLRLSAVPSR